MVDVEEEYPSRRRSEEHHTQYVELLIEQLSQLASDTDPNAGDPSSHAKDRKAFEALRTAGRLVKAVAGWAVDHTVGLSHAGLGFVFGGPTQTDNDPEYLARREQADRHDHEAVGAVSGRNGPATPEEARRALLNFTVANPGALPERIRSVVIEGLKALDSGETTPIFTPSPAGKAKFRYRMHQVQIQMLAFVHYLAAAEGITKAKAWRRVSDEFRVDPNTARRWPSDLRKDLGSLEVARAIGFAENSASSVLEAKRDFFDGRIDRDELMARIMIPEARYGSEAVKRVASEYRALQGHAT